MAVPHGLTGRAYVKTFAAIGAVIALVLSWIFYGWTGLGVCAAAMLALMINRVTDNEIG
jgi:hypothetical protein